MTKPIKRTAIKRTKSKPIPKEVYQDVVSRDMGCRGSQLPGLCQGKVDPHHKKLRSQGGKDTMDNLILLCRFHHDWVHLHPDESYALGFLKHGWE